MGFFDNLDIKVSGDFANYGSDLSIPSAQQLFPTPSFMTDGQTLIDDRANTSFWNFDQSKISAGISSVIGSVADAAVRTGTKLAGDAINKAANGSNENVSQFFKNFQSTQTGAQIQAGANLSQAQNFLNNPMVWLGVVGVMLFFLIRK